MLRQDKLDVSTRRAHLSSRKECFLKKDCVGILRVFRENPLSPNSHSKGLCLSL